MALAPGGGMLDVVNRKLTFASLVLGALALRPRLMSWGSTEAEREAPLPLEAHVPGGRRGWTIATTIDAPPSAVWPWLVQMGLDRAGWYSFDALDMFGGRSADAIMPELQHLKRGDRLASTPGGKTWFEVAGVEPQRYLVLRAPIDFSSGRNYDPRGARPPRFIDTTWTFVLSPLPGDRTRLVTSGEAARSPVIGPKFLEWLFWDPAHLVMQLRQFHGLRERARRTAVTAEREASAPSVTAA